MIRITMVTAMLILLASPPAQAGLLKRLFAPLKANKSCIELSYLQAELDTARSLENANKFRGCAIKAIEPLVFCEFWCRNVAQANIEGVKTMLTGKE